MTSKPKRAALYQSQVQCDPSVPDIHPRLSIGRDSSPQRLQELGQN
jgi:hypothetical protein